MMSLSQFHPIVARWFSETLGEPTRAQAQGWAAIRARRHTLIAAPTGSGKTLAAFLTALDDLVREGVAGPLPDEVRVVYVSPLKALSADIHKNLAEPRRGIRRLAEEQGLEPPRMTAAVRTGDTTQAERAAMLRTPPHILVTTPESLYLLLTAGRSRGILRTVRTVIVDEIHDVIGTRRRMTERAARHLSDRLGEDAVTAHHGSLSKERRLDAEARLKGGRLKALVATASLELGIDIGSVDLVCQIGSPHRIATLLQRFGRSGHTVSGTPKGRLFPLSRDDLIECAALLRVVRRGGLDRIVSHDAPPDVLAQQIVAQTACRDYGEDELYALVRRSWPYRDLSRSSFDAVVSMTAEGFATKRGRRSALTHRDEVNGRVRGRRGARLLAIASGGAIPEVADYRVVLDPEDTFIGTLNEDFAIESAAGDVFQLGNASWQVLRVGTGVVRVSDAKGAPPTIPFWLGEAPARSDELSRAVSDLRADVEVRLKPDATRDEDARATLSGSPDSRPAPKQTAADWMSAETGIPPA